MSWLQWNPVNAMPCAVLGRSIVSDSLWPHDCSPQGSSVHGILQAKTLEWVAMPSSRGSSQPRDWTQVSHIAGRSFTVWATREAQDTRVGSLSFLLLVLLGFKDTMGRIQAFLKMRSRKGNIPTEGVLTNYARGINVTWSGLELE